MSKDDTGLVWFRRDLRTSYNLALTEACKSHAHVVGVYIWAPEEESPWEAGAASNWFLYHALESLSASLMALGVPLVILRGPTKTALQDILESTKAKSIYWNRLYEPQIIQRDTKIKDWLKSNQITAQSHPGYLPKEPWELLNQAKKPYQVFTPYWKALKATLTELKISNKKLSVAPLNKSIKSLSIRDLKLLPDIPWDSGLKNKWQNISENGAKQLLKNFIKNKLDEYKASRDFPELTSCSDLSPYIHFGIISPHQIWDYSLQNSASDSQAEPFLRQLAWRDFGHYLLYHFPHTPLEPLRAEFKKFKWQHSKKALKAWKSGQTGYPIVDAGMRELWATGIMHNRVRMVVASFLVKHLLINWTHGARWFWDTLVDANLANNTLGWQWTAGCGADAAPYFRIFNPVLQGEKFDKDGAYVRRWVPELEALPSKWIHRPWDCPSVVLDEAKIVLGKTYPTPIVDHAQARRLALEMYEQMKRTS